MKSKWDYHNNTVPKTLSILKYKMFTNLQDQIGRIMYKCIMYNDINETDRQVSFQTFKVRIQKLHDSSDYS